MNCRICLLSLFTFLLTSAALAQRVPTLGSTINLGDASGVVDDEAYYLSVDYLDETHVIAAFKRKGSNSGSSAVVADIYAVVGEINPSTGTITWGTGMDIVTEDNTYPQIIGLSATQAIIAYEYSPASGTDFGRASILTISGTTIQSVGSPVQFGDFEMTNITGMALDASKFVIVYADKRGESTSSNYDGTAVVGVVSGSTLSFQTSGAYNESTFSTTSIGYPTVKKVSSTRILIGYEDGGTSGDPGEVVLGDLSGNSFTFETPVQVHSSVVGSTSGRVPVGVIDNSTFVVGYSDETVSTPKKAYVKIGTINSDKSITLSSAIEYEGATDFTGTSNASAIKEVHDASIQVLSGNEFGVVYTGNVSGDKGYLRIGERSGNSVSFGDRVAYHSAFQTDDNVILSNSSDAFYIFFIDETNTPSKDRVKYIYTTLPAAAPSSATVEATVFLEGAYNGTNLNTTLNASIPTAQPYAGSAYNNHAGTESASAPANAVDWVLVELREAGSAAAALNSTKVGSAAGFLMSDGSIKATDGTSNLSISLSGNTGSDFYVVIYHRNHLPIMSAAAISESSGTYTVDLTSSSASTYQTTSALATLSGGKFGMPAGDTDGDGDVDATDLGTWRTHNGATFSYGSNGAADFNLDGVINAVDRNNFQQKNTSKTRQVPST